jgi:hypothetical protein
MRVLTSLGLALLLGTGIHACSAGAASRVGGAGGATAGATTGSGGANSGVGGTGIGTGLGSGGAAPGAMGSGGAAAPGATGGSPGSTGGTGTAGTGGTASATGGAAAPAGAGSCSLACATAKAGSCSVPQVRITQVDLGSALSFGTDETDVLPLAIAAMPGGGSRIAWMTGYSRYGSSTASQAHLAQLDCDDKLVGTPSALAAHDFQDIAADANGGVIVLTRDAQGSGDQHCGDVNNLCILPSDRPGCYDTYMVRYDCAGNEQWATELTSSTASVPPYVSMGAPNLFVWWYQHQGRLAYDGTNYAAYFCDAITVTNNQCVNGAGKIDIHEGDRMQVVAPDGTLVQGHDSFGIGCSHSGFTRIVWDQAAGHFAMICKTDNNNRIAQPNPYRTVYPVTLDGSYVGDLVVAPGGGYWLTVSNDGAVHLLHFNDGQAADQDVTLASASYPHLVAYGAHAMLAAWAASATGNMTAQVLDAGTGAAMGDPFAIDVPGHPYQSFKTFPDGSVAYASIGSGGSTIQIARVLPCE